MSQTALGTQTVTQIAIVVKDIERAGRAFAAALGTPVPAVRLTDPADQAHTLYQGQPTTARAKLAFISVGPVAIELIEPVGGPSTWQEHLDRHGESVHHIAFHVPDMDAALRHLNGLNHPTQQTGDYKGGCYAYVDTARALGVTLELLASRP
jgi:methylmalonyl-CoA/ethylmalonyl-CoA epimerase